ncbi:exodeoxyribonuclease VII large subunit [[Acholeplasma] multilocale]|uniref:exodeoxyribonuclease VII large subunit n=1 Tax=[Acholeplasma] multilocale TaxID=264638 RepID=UPI000478782E|nr:exodeoxyribonuclease VII large subunit [[Acholeplasma] multilocale]
MEQILTVQELNQILKTGLEQNEYLKNLYVTGEISNLTFNKSGHVYFSIKDESSSVNCMIWKDKAQSLIKLNPKEGMKITCLGRITYYIPTGRVSFEVRDVKIEGKGELQQLFDNRKTELQEAGWFDQSIKKPIPKFPTNIGIVTADTGVAVHDLITTIKRRMPSINIFLFPSQVQGEQAQFDIAKKIIQANNFSTPLDILIVGRGGGSYEDLWSFNEMPVLKAIKDSVIPVISAVGHEPDVTLADYVADLRAATPTAAGEIASPSMDELKNELSYNYKNMKMNIANIYKRNAINIKTFTPDLTIRITNLLNVQKQRFESNSTQLLNSMNNHIKSADTELKNITERNLFRINNLITNDFNNLANLSDRNTMYMKNIYTTNLNYLNNTSERNNLLNPIKPLEKGFALLLDDNNKVIRKTSDVAINQDIKIKLKDGHVITNIKEIYNGK